MIQYLKRTNTDTSKTKCWQFPKKSFLRIKCSQIANYFPFGFLCLLFRDHDLQKDMLKRKQNMHLIKNHSMLDQNSSMFIYIIIESVFKSII